MDQFFAQIFNILTTAPGNLIYYLVIAFSVVAALQASLAASRSGQIPSNRRTTAGLFWILTGQLVLFLSSGLAWQNVAVMQAFAPVLDRAVTTLSLIWIAWLWCFPRQDAKADLLNLLLSIGAVIFALVSYAGWTNQTAGTAFNSLWYDLAWHGAMLVVALLAAGWLIYRRAEGWGTGTAFFLLIILGTAAHWFTGDRTSSYAAAMRLAQLCAFPLLPTLVHRFLPQAAPPTTGPIPNERRRYTADARAVYAWLNVANEPDPAALPAVVSRAVAQTMLADMCYLVAAPSYSRDFIIRGGFDLIREEALSGAILPNDTAPALAGAIQRARPLRLNASAQASTPDLTALANIVGLERAGNLLYLPLALSSQDIYGGLILLAPYSNRVWTTEDQTYLISVTEPLVQLLRAAELPAAQKTAAAAAPAAAMEPVAPSKSDMEPALQMLQERFNALQEESQITIRRLEQELSRMQTDGVQTAPTDHELEGELRLALEEIAHLQNALAGANMKILALEMQNPAPAQGSPVLTNACLEIARDIRQPVSAILAYADLVNSEMPGLLSELQRKFIERMKQSAVEINKLLDDLLRTADGSHEALQLNPQWLELSDILDHALQETGTLLAEKDINLLIDLPDDLPQVHADENAMHQIFIHLLNNAGAVSPKESSIHLRAAVEQDDGGQSYLLVQLTDSGSAGKPDPATDGEDPAAITQTRLLVEAHGGRFWSDMTAGGTTRSMLLPTPDPAKNRDAEKR